MPIYRSTQTTSTEFSDQFQTNKLNCSFYNRKLSPSKPILYHLFFHGNKTDFIPSLSNMFLSVYINGFKEEIRKNNVKVHGCKVTYTGGDEFSIIFSRGIGARDSNRTNLIAAISIATFFSLRNTADKCCGTVAPATWLL